MLKTFVVHVENKPGVLTRVASLFRRRAFNIDSLTVGRTEKPEVSRMTITVDADQDQARRIEASLYKLVNVLLVEDITDEPAITRDLAMIKVAAQHDAALPRAPVGERLPGARGGCCAGVADHRNHRRRGQDRSPAGSAAPLWRAGNGAHRHRGHAAGQQVLHHPLAAEDLDEVAAETGDDEGQSV